MLRWLHAIRNVLCLDERIQLCNMCMRATRAPGPQPTVFPEMQLLTGGSLAAVTVRDGTFTT